ncbi:MAG TPA: DUF6252 family protein [Pelobium sp.]|nr:DUF6252 family protein [Pelobium sp.]
MKTPSFTPQNLTLLLLALSFMLCTGMKCKKDNNLDKDGLPKATQGGWGLFACKVNGGNWVAKKGIYDVRGTLKKDTLKVWGRKSDLYFESFGFYIYDTEIKENTIYKLDNHNNMFGLYVSNKDCFFSTDLYNYGEAKSTNGEVIFTKIRKVDDYTAIISGTFWFNIKTDKCGDLKISNGRFDINTGTGNVK